MNALVSSFIHLNTYGVGIRPLYIFYSFSAGIDFRSQNLTSVDVRFLRLQMIPALKGLMSRKAIENVIEYKEHV